MSEKPNVYLDNRVFRLVTQDQSNAEAERWRGLVCEKLMDFGDLSIIFTPYAFLEAIGASPLPTFSVPLSAEELKLSPPEVITRAFDQAYSYFKAVPALSDASLRAHARLQIDQFSSNDSVAQQVLDLTLRPFLDRSDFVTSVARYAAYNAVQQAEFGSENAELRLNVLFHCLLAIVKEDRDSIPPFRTIAKLGTARQRALLGIKTHQDLMDCEYVSHSVMGWFENGRFEPVQVFSMDDRQGCVDRMLFARGVLEDFRVEMLSRVADVQIPAFEEGVLWSIDSNASELAQRLPVSQMQEGEADQSSPSDTTLKTAHE